MKKPTVVIVCNSLPPYRAHLHARIRNEVPEVEILTACTHSPQDGRWPAVDQNVVPHVSFAPNELTGISLRQTGLIKNWKTGGAVIAWLNQVRPAAVIVHGYDDPTRVRVFGWCVRKSLPVFISADSNIKKGHPTGIRGVVKSCYVTTLLRFCDGGMPFGSGGTAYFRKFGMPLSRIYRIPLEPDYAAIRPATANDTDAAAALLALPAGRRRIIYSGRLSPEKRIDLLISAFAEIAERRPNWDLLLLGSGPQEQALRDLVPPGLSARIVFLAAKTNPTDVFDVYRACDLLVLASAHDAWALVVNEAAASGLAIICSDVVGAAADLVREGVNGRTFRSGDVAALAKALLEVSDPANIDRYRAASPKVLAEWRRVADPVEGFRSAMRAVGVLRSPG